MREGGEKGVEKEGRNERKTKTNKGDELRRWRRKEGRDKTYD